MNPKQIGSQALFLLRVFSSIIYITVRSFLMYISLQQISHKVPQIIRHKEKEGI